MKKFTLLILFFFCTNAYAGAPTRPNTYTDGTTIRSAEVNNDFDTVYNYLESGVQDLSLNALDRATEISSSLCSNGQVFKKTAGVWACATPLNSGTSLPATCTTGSLFVDTNSNDCADTAGGDGALCVCSATNTWTLIKDY